MSVMVCISCLKISQQQSALLFAIGLQSSDQKPNTNSTKHPTRNKQNIQIGHHMTITTALIAFCCMTIFALALEIMYTYATQGFGFGFSSNRPMIDRSPLALRIQRAYQNQVESARLHPACFRSGRTCRPFRTSRGVRCTCYHCRAFRLPHFVLFRRPVPSPSGLHRRHNGFIVSMLPRVYSPRRLGAATPKTNLLHGRAMPVLQVYCTE